MIQRDEAGFWAEGADATAVSDTGGWGVDFLDDSSTGIDLARSRCSFDLFADDEAVEVDPCAFRWYPDVETRLLRRRSIASISQENLVAGSCKNACTPSPAAAMAAAITKEKKTRNGVRDS
jgi:hypothetical protein